MGESSSSIAKIRVAGAWAGLLEVPLGRWTVNDLRAEVSRLSGIDVHSLNLISAGKNLRDGESCLVELGMKANSKLLVTKSGKEQAVTLNAESDRLERLARFQNAALRVAERYGLSDGAELQLENQEGQALHFSETEQRALVTALLLHSKSRQMMEAGQYTEALELMQAAEASFSLFGNAIMETTDNMPILLIDIVWCMFMLQDINQLVAGKERLAKARDWLRRSHGQNLERLRVLQPDESNPNHIYVRLELLEGVVEYHSGNVSEARRLLLSANEKLKKLQVNEESLAFLKAMGISDTESRKALRACGQDVSSAAEYAAKLKKRMREKYKEDKAHLKQQRTLAKYGKIKTESGEALDLQLLQMFTGMGYDEVVVVQLLKVTNNDIQATEEALLNPSTPSEIMNNIGVQPNEELVGNEEDIVEKEMTMSLREDGLHEFVKEGEAIARYLSLVENYKT